MTREPEGDKSSREDGLRWLARSNTAPELNLQHVLQQPYDPAKSVLRMTAMRALVAGVAASMPAGTKPDQRATALWRLIQDELDRLAQPEGQRRRAALTAALHLDPDNTEPSIDKRLLYARNEGKFGQKPSGRQHGYDALRAWWGSGVRMLGHAVDERLDFLGAHPEEWKAYFDNKSIQEPEAHRRPSKGAQPVFVDLFVTTVFMKGRAVYRRITERLITARADGVEYYTARGFAGKPPRLTYAPVWALWGCSAELVEPSHDGRPAVTRLWFPTPLRAGDQAHFASEVVDENIVEERHWIDVDIDHHGIARGRLLYGDRLPVSGLTIRVRFDEGYLPEAVWWYAELNESERYDRPPPGDRRLLMITGNDVQHTFTDQACQPRESYGLAFSWPLSENKPEEQTS